MELSMRSIDIIKAKETIKAFLNNQNMPKELQRMIVKEVYEDIQKEALNEALEEMKKEESTNEVC